MGFVALFSIPAAEELGMAVVAVLAVLAMVVVG